MVTAKKGVLYGESSGVGGISEDLRFTEVVEMFPVPILVHQKGKWIYVNGAASKLSGYSKEELYNMFFWELLAPESQQQAKDIAYKRERYNYDEVVQYEVFAITKDQKRLVLELTTGLIMIGGEPAVMVVANNITSKKEMEDHLKRVQKLEALGTLAAGLSHEFNNLLHKISLYIETLFDRQWVLPEGKPYLCKIQETISRSSGMIKRLLDFSRSKKDHLCAVNVEEEIKSVVSFFRKTIPGKIKIVEEYATEIGEQLYVKSNDGQIEQVVLNLLTNARDAIGDKPSGLITIRTERVHISPFQALNLKANPGDYVLITVGDNGVGIEPEHKRKVFDMFFTTKPPGLGTGLGLSVVQNIVSAQGGIVTFESVPQKGTTFYVYLPLLPVEDLLQFGSDGCNVDGSCPCSEILVYPRAASPKTREITIWIVEDDASVRELTRESLERCGFRVLTAADGLEFIGLIKKNPRDVDLIVMDVNMPGLDGVACLTELLNIRKDVPILITSGYVRTQGIEVLLSNFTKRFALLNKPYRISEFIQKINSLLDIDDGVRISQ